MKAKNTLLVVASEDSRSARDWLTLGAVSDEVRLAHGVEAARAELAGRSFETVVLDAELGGAAALVQELRGEAAVIVTCAAAHEHGSALRRLELFEAGAADVIDAPYSAGELRGRVTAAQRRCGIEQTPKCSEKGLTKKRG